MDLGQNDKHGEIDCKTFEIFHQVHDILSAQWQMQNEEEMKKLLDTSGESEALNLIPAIQYKSTACAILVRSIIIGNIMFVHFVSDSKSFRLDIKIPHTDKKKRDINLRREYLKARIQRNVINYFDDSLHPATEMAPELDRLAQPVMRIISFFLHLRDFVRLTLTNKHFNKMSELPEIWKEYLYRDFPATVAPEKALHPKAQYLRIFLRKKMVHKRKHCLNPLETPYSPCFRWSICK